MLEEWLRQNCGARWSVLIDGENDGRRKNYLVIFERERDKRDFKRDVVDKG
jgi:hypothetical protein